MNAQQLTTQLNQLPEVTRHSLAIQIKLLAAKIRAKEAAQQVQQEAMKKIA